MHLDRAEYYKDSISRVIKEEEKYGTTYSTGEHCCIISYPCASDDVNMDRLRSLLLGEHTARLLSANGYVNYHSIFRKNGIASKIKAPFIVL